ncbi:hypothetical protein AOG23_11350 [Rhizobium acidisoli]|nr:hypothetical protein AOG23_11350 [Rhizobium acidisoli]
MIASFPQDLLHRLAISKLVDQLIEVADFPHQRVAEIERTISAERAIYAAEPVPPAHGVDILLNFDRL